VATAASAPAHMWFVKIGGDVWGPYPQARVAAFAREGRVKPATLLSPFAQGPWAPAADAEEFAAALRPAPPAAATLPGATRPHPAPGVPPGSGPPLSGPARSGAVRPLDFDIVERDRPPPPAAGRHPPSAARAATSGPERAILVFAELTSVAPAAFQAGLGRLGGCAQVRPGLWLLRAPTTAAALRNMLSSRLGAADTLLVVEAPLDQAAWFNLAPSSDRELRRLWSGG
jgi:hypothetical protein